MTNAYTWLKDAIIYQIYPQSFQDSNGDGIGDIQGIVRRLDYIKDLGADVIWLNPCFDSPFGDAGYDIRDFYKVASRYGNESDLIALFDAAHERGIRVVLDLVAGHTSMDHPWFLEEAADPHSPEANRYIWKDRNIDSEKGPTKENFLGNFFWYQPALNFGYAERTESWQDPVDAPGPMKNREELRKIMAYWFDRGCDGFRVDMAPSLIKGDSNDAPNSKSLAATQELWRENRAWLDANYPDKALIAEWSYPTRSIPAGFHLDFIMHFNAPGYHEMFFNGIGSIPDKGPCYFSRDGEGDLGVFRDEYHRQLEGTRGLGWVSLPVANHDFQRLHCGPRTNEELHCAWVFFMTQAGPPTIYYGEEIGMRYLEEAPTTEGSLLVGITAANAGTDLGERAGSRTPMQWDQTTNGGFSTAPAEDLYLMMDPDPNRPTVAEQEDDPGSLLNFVRSLIDLRKSHPALGSDGSHTILNPKDAPYPLLILRALGDERYLIALNPSQRKHSMELPLIGQFGDPLIQSGIEVSGEFDLKTITVAPFGYAILPMV